MLLETAVAGLGQALIDQWGTDGARGFFDKHRDAKALRDAVAVAAKATDADPDQRTTFGRYDINRGFFEHEAADEIAKLLLPGSGPDARELAHAAGADRSADRALVVAFEVFLEKLVSAMGSHGPFRRRLAEVGANRTSYPGRADERELAGWLVECFRHLDTAGIGTSRHLQLRLDDVYVPARAVRERQASERWGTREEQHLAVLRERLHAGELEHEEYEAELDRLEAGRPARAGAGPECLAVLDALRNVEQALVLGDPGSGKTTLLQYLVLQHSRALLEGRAIVDSAIGSVRLPLYVRAGDFARHRDRDRGLGAFIATYLLDRLECPMDPMCLRGLITTRLQAGRCLVLIDGLDEVASAGERLGVVEAIAGFALAQRPRGNHVVCSSRVAGYAAAPLPSTFTALRLLDMDDAAIQRFLRGYVPAIERREAPDKAKALVKQDSERTVGELLDAFGRTPGIRRLAANPLLLTTLLLVHRTTGGLPERRVDAYKAVVDALGRTWRANQGVPESELPDERQLTRWLTVLAEWMHAKRPEGTATLRDLLGVLGPLWADLNRRDWDETVLQAADPASTDAGAGIREFVEQIERHCGLLVERAPGRWGFPHLTFEEFYAGRALAFPARVRDRPEKIRARLHDPRYDEPILLALGLVGRDYEGEIDDLVRTALLAESDESRALGLTPTALEGLLGRDFRFALRALADDIPAGPRLVDALLNQALDEALSTAGRGRFAEYTSALLQRIAALKPIALGARTAALLAARLDNLPSTDGEIRTRLIELASNCPAHPDITHHLELIATNSANRDAGSRAAQALAGQGELSGAVVERLVELIATTREFIPDPGTRAARVLAAHAELSAATVERLEMLAITTAHGEVATQAARVLAGQGELTGAVVDRLIEAIAASTPTRNAIQAAQVLVGRGKLTAASVERLVELLAARTLGLFSDPGRLAVQVLAGQELSDEIVERLEMLAIGGDHDGTASRAAEVLAEYGALSGGVVDRLELIAMTAAESGASAEAARLLAGQGKLSTAVVERLVELIAATSPDKFSRGNASAAEVLAGQGKLPDEVVARLELIAIRSVDDDSATSAAEALAGQGELLDAVVDRLARVVTIDDQDVRLVTIRAAQLLEGQGELPGEAIHRLVGVIERSGVDRCSDAATLAAIALTGHAELSGDVVGRLRQLAQRGHSAAYSVLWRA